MRRFEIWKNDDTVVGEGVEWGGGGYSVRLGPASNKLIREFPNQVEALSWLLEQLALESVVDLEFRYLDEERAPVVTRAERPASRILELRDARVRQYKNKARRAEQFERYRREYEQAATIEAIVQYLEEQYSAGLPVVPVTGDRE